MSYSKVLRENRIMNNQRCKFKLLAGNYITKIGRNIFCILAILIYFWVTEAAHANEPIMENYDGALFSRKFAVPHVTARKNSGNIEIYLIKGKIDNQNFILFKFLDEENRPLRLQLQAIPSLSPQVPIYRGPLNLNSNHLGIPNESYFGMEFQIPLTKEDSEMIKPEHD